MKKSVVLVIIGSCLLFGATVALAGSIVGSPHDFTPLNGATFVGGSDEVCIYCHTPHGAVSKDTVGTRVPLWNRTLNEGYTFTMYSNPDSLDAVPSSKPTGNTLLCLSCHDGVSNMGDLINGGPVSFNPPTMTSNNLIYPSGIAIGRDLSNDHPVSFLYDDNLVNLDKHGAATNQLATPGVNGANLTPLKLYNQKMECGTCHEPHDYDTNPPFLRMSNAGSDMCRKCHLK